MLKELEKRDQYLDALEAYVKANPDILPVRGGEMEIPRQLVDVGTAMKIHLTSYGSYNAAFTVTHNCFGHDSEPEQIPLSFEKQGEDYVTDVEICFDQPGNTRLEYWVNRERLVRQVAVLDKGYMAVIPWVGSNAPYLDEELHRFDLSGDYWMDAPGLRENPAETVKKFLPHIRNHRRYGDHTACFINGRTILPTADTDCLFELPTDIQRKGLQQIKRQTEILGYDKLDLVASYTPGSDTMHLLEEMGVKGLTSLCAWQNWQDGGWKINHCGVANQPYYPAEEDFRRAGKERDIMCYTMGSATCNRNYSIMLFDGCPSNIVPGERYAKHRVVNQQLQRFYDVFDGFIQDSKNNDSLLTVTIALESFRGFMDWAATNEAAIRYMAKKAATERIVFTSAADVSDYHKTHKQNMQPAYFFQPDYFYGYHHMTKPGRVDDRLEADTPEFLAVIRRSSMLPMYYYDYTKPWESVLFEDTERNEYGHVDPDVHKPSECYPKQVYTEDMEITSAFVGNRLEIRICSESPKEKMVSGVFDVPFEADFAISFDKDDVKYHKLTDRFTGNTHLFLELGKIAEGESVITAVITGKCRIPKCAELIKDGFGAMYFGDHAYLRSTDRDAGVRVTVPAPDGAYLRLISGKKIAAKAGMLTFTVNTNWEDESSILYGYDQALLEENLKQAIMESMGPTACKRVKWE